MRKEKTYFWIAFLLVGLLLSLNALLLCLRKDGDALDVYQQFTVCIDAGHGGVDGGVTGVNTGVKESDLNLSVSRLLKEQFENCGITVVMTRKTKDGLYGTATSGFKRRDMEKRREIIEQSKPDMVISIHMNKYSSPSRSGPQVFFLEKGCAGEALAVSLQNALNKFTGNSHSALSGDYFILKCTDSPSVIVECGFLSNAEDERKLSDKEYQAQLAKIIFEGAMMYMYSGNLP